MIVLVCGMPRSASTWSYNVCRALAEEAGRRVHPASGIYETDELPDPDGFAPAADEVLLLKCHHPPRRVLTEAAAGRSAVSRIVFTVRDPRAAAASLTRTFGTSFKNAAREIQRSLLIWDLLSARGAGLLLPYAQVGAAPAELVRATAAYLDLPCDETACTRIAQALSRETLREKVAGFDDSGLRALGPTSHDPETLLTRAHFPDARETDWRRALTPAQAYFASTAWGRWLARLNADSAAIPGGAINAPAAGLLALRCRLWRERL